MKRLILIFGFLLVATGAMACDTYTSTENLPGERVLTDEGVGLTVKQGAKIDTYTTSSAGTGTGVRVAYMDGQEPLELVVKPGEVWLGTERFTEYCQ